MNVVIPERRRITISGKVQGVAFLLWARNVANSLDLSGSVRPLEDGRCEVVVQGDRRLVKQFVVACKRGPAEARIEGVEQSIEPVNPRETTFVVYRTPWRRIADAASQ
ncbi:MAG: acylphosphatase [Dehalococcoidia bacterium]|nr:acylphosphatase [Dehalococcoidia bacterium]